jgi:Domain of unknown function (DUF4262)
MPMIDSLRIKDDEQIEANIAKFGCHVISVFDAKQVDPTFTYSIGIQACTGAPEVIIIGLSTKLGHSMVNEYNNRLRKGVTLQRGTLYDDFIEGFGIYVEPANPLLYAAYMRGCDRYYRGTTYDVVQLIYPTTSGVWPWQREASESFKAMQPLLGKLPPDYDVPASNE